ncbi:Hint domain-containing protein [Thioclava sp. A2]|uniref:Hint domain-containing protein n=1 Tax=Thioclava sp. FCG-A2 TaxID=3080562 RepID=UPI002952968A|nr:Hint domain-containing protein [Thioclava sp. A2]MDV7269902.1 Hint domain-containing protein [Thioclava sp. A2]
MAVFNGTSGNNIISGTTGADSITGLAGNDSLSGGAGNDTLVGTGPVQPVELLMNWSDQVASYATSSNIAGGFTQNTGGINVAVSYADLGLGTGFTASSNTNGYVAAGEPFAPNSAGRLQGAGGTGPTSSVTFDFSSVAGSGLDSAVSDVSFRLWDVDNSSWTDIVTIRAYDENGAEVPVSLSATQDIINGQTVTGTGGNNASSDLNGSVLVQAVGPLSRIVVSYANQGSGGQVLQISDVAFTAIQTDDDTLDGGDGDDLLIDDAGNDLLLGGAGADTIFGGLGADTLDGGADNDQLSGGEGNDSIRGDTGDDFLDGGAGADTLLGGTGLDTLHGGAGGDYISGGAGMDYLDYSDSGAGVSINLGSGAASGGDAAGDTILGVDGIYGSAFNDTLVGFNGQIVGGADAYTNVFYGNEGDDYLDGAGGGDSLFGGSGNDTILGGAGNDYLEGGAGLDAITGGTGSDTISLYFGQDAGEAVDGSEDADDTDIDELVVYGRARVIYDAVNSESGTIRWANGETTSFANIENITLVPCFTPGTMIETAQGPLPVEDLRPGMRVLTRDNGYQELRWAGQRKLARARLEAQPELNPIRICAGALGNGLPDRDMIVSPQHRMLISGVRAELLFGENEVLVAALYLLGLPGVERLWPEEIIYIHLLFDAHEIILAESSWTESFQPGEVVLQSLESSQLREILTIFPELKGKSPLNVWPSARPSLKSYEAKVLLAG